MDAKTTQGINMLYDQMQDLVNDWIAEQDCDTEEKWQALMQSVEANETLGFEKEMYKHCIQMQWDNWFDEQTGADTLS